MKTETIENLEGVIADNCTPIDREARFDEMLDEAYSFEKVGGPFAYMSPSRVLKEMDPVAYRCGVNDYEDAEEWVEVGDSYYERRDVEKEIDEYKSALESEIMDIEDDIEEGDATADQREKLAKLQAQLAEVEAYASNL